MIPSASCFGCSEPIVDPRAIHAKMENCAQHRFSALTATYPDHSKDPACFLYNKRPLVILKTRKISRSFRG